MHSSNFEIEGNRVAEGGGEVLVSIAALVTEGRIPLKSTVKTCGFYEGPHCKNSTEHNCDSTNPLCSKYEKVRSDVLELWEKRIPLCVEVVLTPRCSCEIETDQSCSTSESDSAEPTDSDFLLEQWLIAVNHRRIHDNTYINLPQLINAVRSQLHFSQISAWLTAPENSSKISKNNIVYRLSFPGETLQMSNFRNQALKHDFPTTDIGNGLVLQVTLFSLPRLVDIPAINCNKCEPDLNIPLDKIQIGAKQQKIQQKGIVDDRMHVTCTLKGKHRCEDYDEFDCRLKNDINIAKFKRVCNPNYSESRPSTSKYVEPYLSFDQKTQYNTYYSKLGSETRSKLNANEKRNSNSNVEQRIKNSKLDMSVNNGIVRKQGINSNINVNDLNNEKEPSKGDILLNAILRSSHLKPKSNDQNCSKDELRADFKCEEDKNVSCDFKCVQKFGEINPNSCANAMKGESDTNNSLCDNLSASGDIFSTKDKSKINIYLDKHCDSPIPKFKYKKIQDISNIDHNQLIKLKARKKITFSEGYDCSDDRNKREFCDEAHGNYKYDKLLLKFENNGGSDIPSASEQAQFRKSLDNATSMVFHARTGLPLTSSPAPIRRGKSCFDFDSSINSVSAIGNALCSLTSDDESESDSSAVSPCSPETYSLPNKEPLPIKCYKRKHPNNLLGTFEESVLNGRLEPVSTVHGFTAELGASGSFVPKHLVVPVTVFFYSLGDNEKVSSPFLGHINLGRKGYHVPKSGTVQVTLFNPLGTVVKMFVIMYDLNEMPPNTQTFIRQRTLYMPTNCRDENLEWGTKWLRYLIHLRFMSSKSGRTYLHSDIRMIIFRKFDLDTATAHDIEKSYELRSFTHMPTNPRFSPRKKV